MNMTKSDPIKYAIPHSKPSYRLSRAALGLLGATLFLAVLLSFSTYKYINRSKTLMESFLSDKGETIVRSIEAGIRASMIMMHHIKDIDPLHTLLTEHSKEKDILFIVIFNKDGSIYDQTESAPTIRIPKPVITSLTESKTAVKEINSEAGIFTFTKTISMSNRMLMMHQQTEFQRETQLEANGHQTQKIISVGLLTKEFDIARKQDVRHALFMGAILFLVGTAGMYFLFLYKKMRLIGTNLADMKLYTDSVIESIPVSLITLDARDNIVSCNKNTQEIFACQMKELVGKNIDDALPDCSAPITKACETQYEQSVECVTCDGRNIPLHMSCSPLINHNDEKIGKVLIIRDMSSIKQMKLQLERSRRMAALGKMAAGIAHEIRNPLSTLRGFAQFFGGQPGTGEDGRKYSALMVSEIDRLNHTVSGLLQFSRPREPNFQRFPLEELVRKTVTLLKTDLENRSVQLDLQENPKIILNADPDLLLQVFMNLLKNSINATVPGATISLTSSEDKSFTRIAVTDNGCGMSEKERERMFDPFFSTTKTGTGLGLAVSHQIIEEHHGTFEVQTKKDQGTTVTIVLPK